MKFKIFLLLFLLSHILFCEVHKEFQYTGFLREFGQTVSGQRTIVFNIYSQPTVEVPSILKI
ncbi:MAG: hypothetical protein ABDH23_02940 [Endomicrobiia bacterium]